MTEYLAIEKRDGCMWLKLDRADKANALTVGMDAGGRGLRAWAPDERRAARGARAGSDARRGGVRAEGCGGVRGQQEVVNRAPKDALAEARAGMDEHRASVAAKEKT